MKDLKELSGYSLTDFEWRVTAIVAAWVACFPREEQKHAVEEICFCPRALRYVCLFALDMLVAREEWALCLNYKRVWLCLRCSVLLSASPCWFLSCWSSFPLSFDSHLRTLTVNSLECKVAIASGIGTRGGVGMPSRSWAWNMSHTIVGWWHFQVNWEWIECVLSFSLSGWHVRAFQRHGTISINSGMLTTWSSNTIPSVSKRGGGVKG